MLGHRKERRLNISDCNHAAVSKKKTNWTLYTYIYIYCIESNARAESVMLGQNCLIPILNFTLTLLISPTHSLVVTRQIKSYFIPLPKRKFCLSTPPLTIYLQMNWVHQSSTCVCLRIFVFDHHHPVTLSLFHSFSFSIYFFTHFIVISTG